MADRDEFHVLVVAYLEFFPELIQKFVEHGTVAIHAEKEKLMAEFCIRFSFNLYQGQHGEYVA